MTGRRGRRTASDDEDGEPGPAAARLRPMVPADLVDVIALEHELFPDDPWTPEMFADEVAQPPESRLYLLAEADAGDGGVADSDIVSGRGAASGPVMAGYAGLMFIPGGTQADVLTIAVRPAYWGQGNRLGAARRAAQPPRGSGAARRCSLRSARTTRGRTASTCGAGSRSSACAGATTSRPGRTRS